MLWHHTTKTATACKAQTQDMDLPLWSSQLSLVVIISSCPQLVLAAKKGECCVGLDLSELNCLSAKQDSFAND